MNLTVSSEHFIKPLRTVRIGLVVTASMGALLNYPNFFVSVLRKGTAIGPLPNLQ